jgi:hypothetical protein
MPVARYRGMSIAAKAYRDAQSHLDDHLARIARSFDGAAADVLIEIDLRIAAREDATQIALPLRVLRDQAGLDPRAIQLLVLAAVPVLDAELAARLGQRIRGIAPTVGELFAILGIAESEAERLIAVLSRAAPLLSHGLVVLSVDDTTPLLHRRLHVDSRVAAFLRGEGLFDQVPAAQNGNAIPDSIWSLLGAPARRSRPDFGARSASSASCSPRSRWSRRGRCIAGSRTRRSMTWSRRCSVA